ncbi:MAG: amidohydrolase [Pseudomonadota bacterium]
MRTLIAAAVACLLASCQQAEIGPTAETDIPDQDTQALTVFTGGTIYTGHGMDTVEAVTVDATGRIIAVSPPTSMDWDESEINLVDLNGAVMFPGFTDGHAHLLGIGQRELTLNLEGTASIAELVTRIETELQGAPAGQVVGGRGWIETGWPEGRMPNAADLDAVSPDHPVILRRADGHALVANSAAMVAAGVTNDTPDVEGGKIERDATGQATGIFIDNAMGQVLALISTPSEDDIVRAFVVGARAYSARGWTGVHNMSVTPAHAALMARLDLEGRMPLRLHNAYAQAGFEIAASRQHETETITNRSVKVYMDGALGSRGALLIEPYADRPETRGLSLMEPEALSQLMVRAETADVQLAIHAIGDLANRRILDEFQHLSRLDETITSPNYSDNRWRIEHTQILHPDDIARVGTLGLIASMQPSHAIGDLKFAPDRLGPNRLYGAYAWQSLLNTNAVIVGGSDAPVEIGTPQIEFYAAVARKDLAGFSTEDWYPEEKLSREQALKLFTSAPAYAAFMEEDLGHIEVGKLADFSVFDRDLMTIPEAEILQAETVMTIVHGEIVFTAE